MIEINRLLQSGYVIGKAAEPAKKLILKCGSLGGLSKK
jgi:hypothetical protein